MHRERGKEGGGGGGGGGRGKEELWSNGDKVSVGKMKRFP